MFTLTPLHYDTPNNDPAQTQVVVSSSDGLRGTAEVLVENVFARELAKQPEEVLRQPLRWGGDKAVVHFASPLPKGANRKAYGVSCVVFDDMACDLSHIAARGVIQPLFGCWFDRQGDSLLAVRVVEGSVVHKAGVRNGDRIISINKTNVRSHDELFGVLAAVGIGTDASCIVERAGSEVSLTIHMPETMSPPRRGPAAQSPTPEQGGVPAKKGLSQKSADPQVVSPTAEKPRTGTSVAKPGVGQTTEAAKGRLRLPDDDCSPDAPITQLLKGTQEGRIEKVVFSPDGASLAASSDSGFVFLWDTRSGRERLCVRQIFDAGSRHITEVRFSADSKSLIVAGGGSIFVIDASTGETRASTKLKDTPVSAKVSPDGACIAIGYVSKEVVVLPIANLEAKKTLGKFPYAVEVFAFSPDSSRVALSFGAWYPDSVKVFECASGKSVWESESINNQINALAFTRDAKSVLACSSDGRIRFLDAQTGKPLLLGREKVSSLAAGDSFTGIETTLDGAIASLTKVSGAGFTIVDLSGPQVINKTTIKSRNLESNDESLSISQRVGFVVETRRSTWHDLLVRVYGPDGRAVVLEMPLPNWEERGLTVSADGTKCAVSQEYGIGLVRLSVEQRRQEKQAEVARGVAERQAAEEAKRMAEEAQRLAKETALQQRIAAEKAREENLRRRNATPEWVARRKLGNLNDDVERSGLDFGKFVRFGTAAVAKKAAGDRFDRMEAQKDASAHADKLDTMSFLWTASAFRCSDEDVPSDDPSVVKQIIWVDLPFRVNDLQPHLGADVSVWDGTGNQGHLWYLTKDRKLAPMDSVPVAAMDEVMKNGVMYVPDSETSQLRICVAGSLEDIKSLVRERKNYVVQFQVKQLGPKKTLHWGYYQKAVAADFGWNTPDMRQKQVTADAKGDKAEGVLEPPIYFRTHKFPDTPELIVGSISRIEVARIDGTARKVIFVYDPEDGEPR
jgi:WD40 repeat protein